MRSPRKVMTGPSNRWQSRFVAMALPFAFGVVLTAGGFVLREKTADPVSAPVRSPSPVSDIGHRSVFQLMGLTDVELEKADVLEMNIAVAREIPGLEKLDYGRHRQIVDDWTDQFRRWLPTVEQAFCRNPEAYKDDANFFRLGMLAQFLDQTIGIRYVPDQKDVQVRARVSGEPVGMSYTDSGNLLVYGLIDTKQGTCGTMPTLHVILGRRMGWPVGLACVKSHFVCRYDDGKVQYNIEATDTGRGSFAEGSDKDYMEKEGLSPKAVACGSDLRKLSPREMLGAFVGLRARHFADTGRWAFADRDYALSRVLFPTHRQAYKESLEAFLFRGAGLFDPAEQGHPRSLLAYLSALQRPGRAAAPRPEFKVDKEIKRVSTVNPTDRGRTMPPQPPRSR